jgi:hypothetical protein
MLFGQLLERSVDMRASRVGLGVLEQAWLFRGAVGLYAWHWVVAPGSRRAFEAASRGIGEVSRENEALGASLEGAGELRARTNVELAEDAAEVRLDRILGHEERLGDLAVRQPFGGHTSDAKL